MCCGQAEHHRHGPRRGADECGCEHTEHDGHRPMRGASECGCGGDFSHQCGQFFWSKKKQIRMLEKLLEQKREEVQDLVDALDELKAK
jgi:hypothetical protein